MSSPSSHRRPALISQAEMKGHILREFSGSTFFVDLTALGAPLHVDANKVEEVLNRLQDYMANISILGNNESTEDAPRFPPQGFAKEDASYAPLTHFLNLIVRAAKDCLAPGYLRDVRFLEHGLEMKDAYDSQKPLKPDVLGLFRSPPGPPGLKNNNICWRDVAIIIEVKKQEHDLVQQLSTYARCHFAADRRRSFSITIAFNHKKLQMRFLIFHRSGISSSHELSLLSEAGVRDVVKHLVGILSIADERAFGLDMTRLGKVFRINDRNYEIVRQIYERNSVCGRATAVYSIRGCAAQDTPSIPQSRYLTFFGETQPPEKMVYKLSYQPEGHTSEGHLLLESLGQFGIVDVVGSHTCVLEEPFTSTAHLIQNYTYWNLVEGEEGNPVKRSLHCTALGLEGLPLLDISYREGIPGPAELLESVLHAMIGHYNLFIGGVLHRDVSNGNIIRLQEPIERIDSRSTSRLRRELGDDINLSSCRGFLGDLDHSIEWRRTPPKPSMDRSGTLPFMSRRLVSAWNWKSPVLHTAVDDLESFTLVLVWCLVHIFKHTLTSESPRVNGLARAFSSYTFADVIGKAALIEYSWPDTVFKGLIQEWTYIADTSSHNLKGRTVESKDFLEKYCEEAYIKYIKAGYSHLQAIRDYRDWRAVVDADGSTWY